MPAATKAREQEICPSCGRRRVLIERTGFCRPCTNEHERGSGPNPGYKAEQAFARQIKREGFPDWGIRCKHGIQGGLHCEWCGNPDRLPPTEQISGVPR